jgi:hypothetical protein
MFAPTRLRVLTTLAVLCLALTAGSSSAFAAEATAKYTDESQQAYEQQLAAGEIAEAVFNKRIRSVHLILKNGQHFRYLYPAKGEPAIDAALTKKHVPVTILTPAEAKKEAGKAPAKHKLRYIAGGILIVVIVIVGGVLLWDRRRKAMAE